MLKEKSTYNIEGNEYKVTVFCNKEQNEEIIYNVFQDYCEKKLEETKEKFKMVRATCN